MLIFNILCVLFFTTCYNSLSSNLFNIHIIPHSHDDAGWQNTFDEYYTGLDPRYCVKCELDSILDSLQNNKERTFSWAEISFFKKWYDDLSQTKKDLVKTIVKEKRLEFVGGSWVMNDEATAYYQNIIDQIRLGLIWLKNEFDYNVKTAWYLDTFGHSVSNAAILSKMGFENLVFARMDWREKELRKNHKSLEFFWRPYFSYDKEHYNPPERTSLNEILIYPVTSVENEASNILKWLEYTKDFYLTNNRLILLGDDFTFKEAESIYTKMELLMNYINNSVDYKDKIRMFYSSTEKYFYSLHQSNVLFPDYNEIDFFPYSDNGVSYWTGFFSSRPFLKGITIDSGRYLETTSNLFLEEIFDRKLNNKVKHNLKDDNQTIFNILHMRSNLGIAQHHDAVTGTSKEIVSIDYIERLRNSTKKLKKTLKYQFIEAFSQSSQERFILNTLIDFCLPPAEECHKKLFHQPNKTELFLVIYNPGLDGFYPLKLNISGSYFDIYEINSNGESKAKYDTICTYIHNHENSTYCTAYIHIQFKKEKKFNVLMVKRLGNGKIIQRKNLTTKIKEKNKTTNFDNQTDNTLSNSTNNNNILLQNNNNSESNLTINRNDVNQTKSEIKITNSNINCLINITITSTNITINNYTIPNKIILYFDFNLIISNSYFIAKLDYLLNCTENIVVRINDLHNFKYNNSFKLEVFDKGFFSTLSDLSNINSSNITSNTSLNDYIFHEFSIHNDTNYSVSFNLKDQFLIYSKQENKNITLKLLHCWLNNFNTNQNIRSGAYILSVAEPIVINPFLLSNENSYIYEGEYLTEVHLSSTFSTMKIRFYKDEQTLQMFEVESIIDPNYIYSDYEFMLLIQSNLDNSIFLNNTNQTEFWTDTNGMKMIRRIRNYRFGWNLNDFHPKNDNFSANFYPVNSMFAIINNTEKYRNINDSVSNYTFLNKNDSIITIFNDRSQGASSFKTGEVLISLTRFSSEDDGRGLFQGMYEYHSQYTYFHLTHWIAFNTFETKSIINRINKKPVVFYMEMDTQSQDTDESIKKIYDSLKKSTIRDSLIRKLIKMEDCLEMNVFILSVKEFIIQFYNNNDYFFHKNNNCKLEFTDEFYENFKLIETSLNTIDKYEKIRSFREESFNLRKEIKNKQSYMIAPQDLKTFLLEYI